MTALTRKLLRVQTAPPVTAQVSVPPLRRQPGKQKLPNDPSPISEHPNTTAIPPNSYPCPSVFIRGPIPLPHAINKPPDNQARTPRNCQTNLVPFPNTQTPIGVHPRSPAAKIPHPSPKELPPEGHPTSSHTTYDSNIIKLCATRQIPPAQLVSKPACG